MMPSLSFRAILPLLAATALLAGCAGGLEIADDGEIRGRSGGGSAQIAGAPPAGAANAPLRGPASCTRPIREFEEVLANDQRIGHISGWQQNQIGSELGAARSACAAGRSRDALRDLAAVRSRHGYR